MAEYFLGLDIGTDSVGWAVTNTEYQITKKHGQALWGVRLFPEAEKAEERRKFRTARRRLERRKQRIEWLRELFSPEIAKVDPAFFLRVDESKYLEADKQLTENGQPLGRYTLFADRDYCDKDYHHEFPTIYHLRKALMEEDRTFDVRLVYLALHHILKNRGHFLFADLNIDDVTFESCIADLNEYLQVNYDISLFLNDPISFKITLTDRNIGASKKKSALRKIAALSKEDVQLCAITDLLAGASVKPSSLLNTEIPTDADKSFSFRDNFENTEAVLIDLLGDDMQLVHLVKRIYDWSILSELRGGFPTISRAKVHIFEQHKDDLQALKRLLKPYPEVYREMFRKTDKIDNYVAYSGHNANNHRCDYDNFSKFTKGLLKKLLPSLNENEKAVAASIQEKLDLKIFLPKQTSKDNGVIPHQLHEQELQIILNRASRYLPFLNDKNEYGLTRSEQIMAVFRFRVPFYVGPLNSASKHSWIVRTNEKIYPWNFDKVVDLAQSRDNFISRMTATCSYIGKPVLPKDSLLYSKFVVLNMLNKLKINGHPISVETKQRIYNEHIIVCGKSNLKMLRNYLLCTGIMHKGDEISGLDEQFKISATGWQVFRQILSRPGTYRMVEDIIKHIVLFGEDRKLLSAWLKDAYGEALTDEDQAYILRNKNRFIGWGNLSEEFLTQIKHYDSETGEIFSIIDALWYTNHNLMELLSAEFTFTKAIEKYRDEAYGTGERKLDEILSDRYASPGIRRAIHQAIAIVSEVEKIMGSEPKRVFVEVTRGESKKERIPSRKRRLDELYASCKKEAPEVFAHLQNQNESTLRSAKLYLYFTQMGKCMYSGTPIDLSRLNVDYDIDHIYPQSVVKDDSLDNRVLVKRELNAAKSDKYPLPEETRSSMLPLWQALRAKKLISEEKYRRLTRNTQFGESERSGFIARQLVETSQSCKIIATLLKNRYGSDKVVYVKAGNVSSFRQDQRILPDGSQRQAWACKNIHTKQDPVFVKCREVNDYHHAKDAYLNIVVGNVYHVKFTRDPLHFVRSQQTYSLNRMFDFDVIRGGECAWKKGEEGSIATVRRMMCKNNILFTRYASKKSGMLFKQTIHPAGKGEAAIKSTDSRMTIDKFGGYTERRGTYFIYVEHTEKKKRVRSIETILLMDKAKYESSPKEYCESVLGLKDPKVLIPCIKYDSLISYNGYRLHISAKFDEGRIALKNAVQLTLCPEITDYIKKLGKYVERCAEASAELPLYSGDIVSCEGNSTLYQKLIDKMLVHPYRVKHGDLARTLAAKKDDFEKMTILTQGKILLEMLYIFRANATNANLSALGGSSRAGMPRISKYVKDDKETSIHLINQSVTGFFEQDIDLMGDTF